MTKKKKKTKINFYRIILVILTIIYGTYLSKIDSTYSSDKTTNTFNEENTTLTVSFIDVGQADSILIEHNNEYMLIDAGNNADGQLLIEYFKSKNITNFKYLVATHPHEDHIGGLDDIINHFNIETLYMPDVITTTKTFTDVLDAIENNNINFQIPKIGEKFNLGTATLEVLYTGTDTKDLNNTSIVLRLDFKNTSFLFTGDATKETEEKLLKNKKNITADVLKVGHHGSKYSTTTSFLNTVKPKYAIISSGKNNIYNHPEDIILTRLKKANIKIHRTDQEGTIIIKSNGQQLEITNTKTNTNG